MLNEMHTPVQAGIADTLVTEAVKTRDKYDAKYFGMAAGIFAIIIFILAVIKSFYTTDVINFLRPFIPFYDATNFINVTGGIIASFIWGFVIGYFFIVFYNFIDRKTSHRLL